MTEVTVTNPSFSGRISGWSARHRWLVLAGTLLVLIGSFYLSSSLGVKTSEVMGAGEAQRANELMENRFAEADPPSESILIGNPDYDVGDAEFQTAVAPIVAELKGFEGVGSVASYYDTGDDGMVSEDRHVLIVRLVLEKEAQEVLQERARPIMDAVAEMNGDLSASGFEVAMLGGTSGQMAMNDVVNQEFGLIMMIALVGGFIILLLAFGSPIAALVPLAMALTSVFAAIGLAVPVSRLQELNLYYYEMIVLIGLAVGTDYSLFIISRFREERETGRPKLEAIMAASATAGRAVLYAGITVVISVSGLLITRDSLFIGLGLGAMIAVFFSIIASLTLLPALISLLGDGLNRLRIPHLGRPAHGGGIWGFITDKVLARPEISAVLVLAVLLALALPALRLNIGSTPLTTDVIPEKMEGYRALQLMEERFGGFTAFQSLMIIVNPGAGEDVGTPRIRQAVEDVLATVEGDDAFAPPLDVQTNREGDLLGIIVPVRNGDDEDVANAAVTRMREDIIPGAFGNTGVEVLVGGNGAYQLDAANNVKSTAGYVFLYILGLAFVLLLVMFRSIVIPIKAIVLNLISVAAAYGVMVLVFQDGVGDSLLGFNAVGKIEIFMPLFLFAVLFGLSMDYHMLVLSRIKEAYDGGMSNEESVSVGIKSTAALITSAAAIMILVFSAFALSSAMFMKQMGVGLGVAVLMDATLIRVVLLPASMKLLGDNNWYLPRWLEWLPRMSTSEQDDDGGMRPASRYCGGLS
ncbi:MAG: MMPL family transporter [Actinobacteria bacterium]|nr:MMPL family transporter [Actinomycetota bacterium]